MTKIKAKYVGKWDPEYTPGEVYLISKIKDISDRRLIAAENKHGEAYVMPANLFVPIEVSTMDESEIELFIMLNEPVFDVGDKQYSVCCPGNIFAIWDSDGNMYDFPDIHSLLENWDIEGKPFREVVETLMEQYQSHKEWRD